MRMSLKNFLSKSYRFLLVFTVITALIIVLMLPATHIGIFIHRQAGEPDQRALLIRVENGGFSYFNESYGVFIFDNSTLDSYIRDLERRRGKPLIALLWDLKYSESYFLNYTAVVSEGDMKISAKLLGIDVEVDLKCGNFSVRKLFNPNTTIVNKTGIVQVGLRESFGDSLVGYAVYMMLLYEYRAKSLRPLCIGWAKMHEQLLIFDTEGNLVYAFTITLFLMAE